MSRPRYPETSPTAQWYGQNWMLKAIVIVKVFMGKVFVIGRILGIAKPGQSSQITSSYLNAMHTASLHLHAKRDRPQGYALQQSCHGFRDDPKAVPLASNLCLK
ncbi:hypothetical protein BJ165DRAFT_1527948 [Panaeolus papilionaceus]|nr:hypothetical protein BJ165DRAFT_1527948 [Panaeolus papilionaceus]